MPINTEFTVTTTLRPGLLVGLKTSIKGNVKHHRTVIEAETVDTDGTAREAWETKKTVKNAAEQADAAKVRAKARGLIEAVCSNTDFGLLCPLIAKPDLDKALAEARAICEAFNDTSKFTKVRFGAVTGVVAQDDLRAARELRKEVSELIGDMKEGLEQLDIDTVRAAASRAKQIGQMLSPEAATRVQMAVEEARSLARKIVKAGEQGAVEISASVIARLMEARTAFLDIDEPVGEIGTRVVEGRAVDLVPDTGTVSTAPAAPVREIELA